jgi:hypothetical protein
VIRDAGAELLRHARAHGESRARTIALEAALTTATAAARERGIADLAAARGPQLVQASLFDARALKQTWTEAERRDAVRRDSAERTTMLEADSTVCLASDPELVMLLIRC